MNKIDNKYISCILFFLTNQIILSVGINNILKISYQNTIYIPLISIIIGIIPFIIFIRYYNYKPELNVFEKIEYTYGKIGKLINFVFSILVFIYLTYTLCTINIYIQNKYLNNTPTYIISLFFIIPLLYLLKLDIKTICKTSFLLFIIYIFLYVISGLGLIKYFDVDNLKPFIDKNITILFKSSIFSCFYMLYPIFLLLSIPKNIVKNPKTINKHFIFFYIFSFINLFIILINLIGTLGIDLSLLYNFPIFSLLKKINFFDFITHIENILSFMSIIVFFVNASLSSYTLKVYINNNKILFVLIIISIILSLFLFNSHDFVIKFINNYFIYSFIPVLLILLKKKKH